MLPLEELGGGPPTPQAPRPRQQGWSQLSAWLKPGGRGSRGTRSSIPALHLLPTSPCPLPPHTAPPHRHGMARLWGRGPRGGCRGASRVGARHGWPSSPVFLFFSPPPPPPPVSCQSGAVGDRPPPCPRSRGAPWCRGEVSHKPSGVGRGRFAAPRGARPRGAAPHSCAWGGAQWGGRAFMVIWCAPRVLRGSCSALARASKWRDGTNGHGREAASRFRLPNQCIESARPESP